MICPVCKGDISRNGVKFSGCCTASIFVQPGGRGTSSRRHTDQELADHMRAELVRRGYPDPWREM